MAVIDVKNRFTQKKSQAQPVTHIARVDLVALAIMYHLHVAPNKDKAQSLLHVFSTQALDHAAVELTTEQYHAFKDATPHVIATIEATFQKYMQEADSY